MAIKKLMDAYDVVGDIIIDCLINDSVEIKGDTIIFKYKNDTYTIGKNEFILLYSEYYNRTKKPDFLRRSNELNGKDIDEIYVIYSSIFDKLEIKKVIEYRQEFEERLKADPDYYNKVKSALLQRISELHPKYRKMYYDRLEKYISFTLNEKIENAFYYSMASIDELKEALDTDGMDLYQQISAVVTVIAYETRTKKKANRTKITNALNLLTPNQIIYAFLGNGITLEMFEQTKVKKEDFWELDFKSFYQILEKNDSLPKRLKITSEDIVNQYPTKFDETDIEVLYQNGHIMPQDYIQVFDKKSSKEREGTLLEDDSLRFTFSPAKLIAMHEKHQITDNFIDVYLKLMDYTNNPELFRSQSEELVNKLKRKHYQQQAEQIEKEINGEASSQSEEKSSLDQDILFFVDKGLCDPRVAKEAITKGYIENLYLEDKITINQVIDYYTIGLIDKNEIGGYFTDYEQVLEFYTSRNELGADFLAGCINDSDFLTERFCEEKISDKDFLMLYLNYNTIALKDLQMAIELTERVDFEIEPYIDEKTPYDKIFELASNLLIGISKVNELHNKGVITDSQYNEIAESIKTDDFFKRLAKGEDFNVTTTRKGEKKGKVQTRRKTDRNDKDFSSESELISKLLGISADDLLTSPRIRSRNSSGYKTTLDDYLVLGSQERGLCIFYKPVIGNAIYVLSPAQAMFFLQETVNENGETITRDRMKDKAYLRMLDGVFCIQHRINFGENLVKAAAVISPVIGEKLERRDLSYKEEVDNMVKTILAEYIERNNADGLTM